jgi:iron complex outermembrane receptor protein
MGRIMSLLRTSILLAGVLFGGPAAVHAQTATTAPDLKRLSLHELANVVVTSVSKTEETLSGVAAAVTVVTNDDIRRSGATTVPEALRLVPGIHVARQTSNTWAVSARGFSSIASEKLLVLTDTRSLYTPLFSGVFWDQQDLLLEDVERIEVIRGPGAVQWGSNAVNGVINITTKSASDTQGAYVESHAGTEERFAVKARYGGRVGAAAYRLFGQYADRGGTFTTATLQRDDWQVGHAGARVDWDRGPVNSFTLQGDAYRNDIGRLAPSVTVIGRPAPAGVLRTRAGGGNVLARWRRRPSVASELQVRVYYDRTHRSDPSFVDDLDTIDVDLQHRSGLRWRQEVTWGGNYHFTSNRNEGKGVFALDPPSSRDQVVSGFLQHQVQLGDALRLTSGTKLEHNDFSGLEVQPSIRAAWARSPVQTVWGAVSRAVRIPTRFERDIAIDITNPPADPMVRLMGNREFGAERLVAFEAGYRAQPATALLVDLAAFHNRYSGLASLEFGAPVTITGRTVIPILNQNLTDGRAHGVGSLVTLIPIPAWRLSVSSSLTWLDLDAVGQDLNRGAFFDGATPRHQLGLRSMLDLGSRVKLDAQLRHLTSIRRLPPVPNGDGLPGYSELDLRLAWLASRHVQAAVVGQNLLHDHHAEFGPPAARGEVQRGVYASITWRQ